jgi:hypothetical protein
LGIDFWKVGFKVSKFRSEKGQNKYLFEKLMKGLFGLEKPQEKLCVFLENLIGLIEIFWTLFLCDCFEKIASKALFKVLTN